MKTIPETEITFNEKLVEQAIERSMTYAQYRDLVEALARDGKSSSPDHSESLVAFTRLNEARMRRLDKLDLQFQEIKAIAQGSSRNQTWLVITESWCGDAAQTIPLINKIAGAIEGVELKLVLRDREIPLMDAFLTNGARSIPIVIIYDHDRREVLATWGPRPSLLNQLVAEEKAAHGSLSDHFKKELQIWYNKDKGQTTVSDFSALLSGLS
jgi:hypothetical protein